MSTETRVADKRRIRQSYKSRNLFDIFRFFVVSFVIGTFCVWAELSSGASFDTTFPYKSK